MRFMNRLGLTNSFLRQFLAIVFGAFTVKIRVFGESSVNSKLHVPLEKKYASIDLDILRKYIESFSKILVSGIVFTCVVL